jgi:hypothetical protein
MNKIGGTLSPFVGWFLVNSMFESSKTLQLGFLQIPNLCRSDRNILIMQTQIGEMLKFEIIRGPHMVVNENWDCVRILNI